MWRYTRHPNCFGDATQWWAYYLLALAGGRYWTVFSPIIVTALLLRVSGVALLEKSLRKRKSHYQETFTPWFPRKKE